MERPGSALIGSVVVHAGAIAAVLAAGLYAPRAEPRPMVNAVPVSIVSTIVAEAAAADNGVVIRDGEVDPEATARLRASRPARADGEGFFEFGPERAAYEAVWTRQMYDTLTELLWGVPVTWRGFFKGKVFTAVDEISKTRQPTP